MTPAAWCPPTWVPGSTSLPSSHLQHHLAYSRAKLAWKSQSESKLRPQQQLADLQQVPQDPENWPIFLQSIALLQHRCQAWSHCRSFPDSAIQNAARACLEDKSRFRAAHAAANHLQQAMQEPSWLSAWAACCPCCLMDWNSMGGRNYPILSIPIYLKSGVCAMQHTQQAVWPFHICICKIRAGHSPLSCLVAVLLFYFQSNIRLMQQQFQAHRACWRL